MLVICVAIISVWTAQASEVYQGLYKVTVGYKLSQGTIVNNISFQSMTSIYCVLLCNIGCGSATFSLKNKTCITFVEKFYSFNVLWTIDPDWIVLYREEPIQYGEWTLVFRAQTAINNDMASVWNATGQHDDNPLSSDTLNGCYRLDNLGYCMKHFRSHILDNWTNIKQVKLSLYYNGLETKFITFDGTSSTSLSWFSQSRVLNSTWSGLKTDTRVTFFGIFGCSVYLFVIGNCHQYCNNFLSYITVIDQPSDGCEQTWHLRIMANPVFMYSFYDGIIPFYTYPTGYAFADVLAVLVKY